MTAALDAPVRPAPVAPIRSASRSFLRLLRIELRRSPVVLILPLVAALFWYDSYRPSVAQQPLWMLRTFWNMGQGNTIIDFGPFIAGMVAWIGSRDGRRGTADLVTTTVRPRWTVALATWAATAIWAVVAYLVFVGVLFGIYAYQGVHGEPPWWWVGVGVTAVTAFSAAGFAVGTLWPSRFAAPVAAFGGFLAMVMSSQTGFKNQTGWALILPTNTHGNYEQPDSGIFYPYLPDLPIARILFLAGILVALLGLLGLPRRSGGRWLRATAALVTLAGVAATVTAVGLARTAQPGPRGVVIPALHEAANDRPIAYTPVCATAAGTQVCLNPAYGRYLTDVSAALAPALTAVAGLPGAPVRVTQVATTYDTPNWQTLTIGGSPPVLNIALGAEPSLPGSNGFQGGVITTTADFENTLRAQFAHAFTAAAATDDTPAQQAVEAALLQRIGIPFSDQPKLEGGIRPGPGPDVGPATGPVYDAAKRLAAMSGTAWHAWLAANLAALRSGALTLEQLP
jgi:hypothetical protein